MKRLYKGVTSDPVITGLADRSPSYTIKYGFQKKEKDKMLKAKITNVKYKDGKTLVELTRTQNGLNYRYQYPINLDQLKVNSDGTGKLVIYLDEVE